MISWVITRVQKHFFRVLAYGACIIGAWLLLYSAFLKPTNTQRTTVESGGTINQPWKDAQIHVGFGGCAHFPQIKEKHM